MSGRWHSLWTGCKVPLAPCCFSSTISHLGHGLTQRAVGRGHSFVGSSPCRELLSVSSQDLLVFLLDCLDTAGSVVPARHYFLYAEVARAEHAKVNQAFPPLRYCLLCLRITVLDCAPEHLLVAPITAPALTQLSAPQFILMACLRPSHPVSSITQLSHFSMQGPPEITFRH